MHFSHYGDESAGVAVKLTNTLNVVTGEDALETPGDLADFIRTELSGWRPIRTELTAEDLYFTRDLRSRLRSVWEAADVERAASAINEILDLVAAKPRIAAHGDTPPHLRFDPETDDPAKRLGAIAAWELGIALIEDGWARFGTCSSAACDDVYIDTSKNRSRRYCSETCTTREGVAAYRARQKAGN